MSTIEEFEFVKNDMDNKVIYLKDKYGVIHGIGHENFSDWYDGQMGYRTYLAFSNKTLKSEKEEHTMYDSITVSCRGFTGTLVKLEEVAFDAHIAYTISIRELEKCLTHTMEHVSPNEIKLVSGMVTMGG